MTRNHPFGRGSESNVLGEIGSRCRLRGQNRGVRKRWLVLGLVVVVGGGAGTAGYLSRDRGTARQAAVSTAVVDNGPVTMSVAATGTVAASSARSLSFTVDGEVSAVSVQAGAKVAKGAVLASVDAADATGAVADAQDSLDTAEDQLKTAKETAAAAAVAAQVAAAAEAKATAASEAAPSAAVPAKAAASAEAVSTNSANGGVDAIFIAQEKVNQAEITLQEAKAALAGTTIKAPVAGTIMSLAGKVGTQVTKGETFVTLADTNAMKVEADFPEADAGALAVGQTATVTLADRVGEAFAAQVVQVDPVGADDGTLVTYGVVLAFSDSPADLLVGQSAAVQVTTGKVASALRVPSTAVHDVSRRTGQVLVRAGNTSTEQSVEVGLMGDQYTQITSGLAAGDVVVRSW
jgi:HlyD family secretion protein